MILPITARLTSSRTFGAEYSDGPRRKAKVEEDSYFKSRFEQEEEHKREYTDGEIAAIKGHSAMGGVIFSTLSALLIGALLVSNRDNKNKEVAEKALNAVQAEYNKQDTRKDTFEVKDINKDQTPEIILTKKDGSKVAIDLMTGNVLKSKNITTFE